MKMRIIWIDMILQKKNHDFVVGMALGMVDSETQLEASVSLVAKY